MFRRQDTAVKKRQGSKRFLFLRLICFFTLYYVLCTPYRIFAQDFNLGEIVVTAKKGYERSILSIPASITVIDSAAIQKSNAKNVSELLKSEEGLIVRDLYGNGAQTSVDMRGFGAASAMNSVILIDGRRINSIDQANPDMNQISLANVERIEVLRGGASVLYGDNATGGVINIITKKPEKMSLKVASDFDALGGVNLRINAENFVNKFFYGINASHRFNSGYRRNNEMVYDDIGARISRTEENEIPGWDLIAGFQNENYQLPGYINQADWDAGYHWKSYTPYDSAQATSWYSKMALNKSIGKLKTETGLSVSNRTAKSFMDSWGSYNKLSTKIVGAEEKISMDILDVELLGGIEYYNNVYDISPESRTGEPTPITTDDQSMERNSTGGYLQVNIPVFGFIFLEGGARAERYDQHFVIGTASDTFRNEVLNAYNLGLSVKIFSGTNAYVRWSKAFRLPKTDEYYTYGTYNPLLKPQKNEDIECGIKYAGKKIETTLSLFSMQSQDEIYYNNITFLNENYPNLTLRMGGELQAKIYICDFASVSCGYTLTDAKFEAGDGAYAGKYIPLVPRHKGNAKLDLVLPLNINFAADCIMVSDRWYSSDYTQDDAKLAGYTTVDLNVSKQFENLRLFGAITNIGDTKYAETAYKGGYYYPSPPRNFSVGAQIKL